MITQIYHYMLGSMGVQGKSMHMQHVNSIKLLNLIKLCYIILYTKPSSKIVLKSSYAYTNSITNVCTYLIMKVH